MVLAQRDGQTISPCRAVALPGQEQYIRSESGLRCISSAEAVCVILVSDNAASAQTGRPGTARAGESFAWRRELTGHLFGIRQRNQLFLAGTRTREGKPEAALPPPDRVRAISLRLGTGRLLLLDPGHGASGKLFGGFFSLHILSSNSSSLSGKWIQSSRKTAIERRGNSATGNGS
jgi:hypothetical protein